MPSPEARFTAALPLLGRIWRRSVSLMLARFGISEAIAAPLIHLSRNGEGMTQVDLAARIGIGGPSLVRLLDRLAASGLIDRRSDPDDKRANRIFLTDRGAEMAARIEEAVGTLREQVLAEIPEDDIETCVRVFDTLMAALENFERARTDSLKSDGIR